MRKSRRPERRARDQPRGLLWRGVWLPLGGTGFAVIMGETEKLYYVYSCDLDMNVQLKM